MILQDSLWDWFPRSIAWLLVFVGLVAITWMGYERKRQGGFVRGKEGWQKDVDVSTFLRGFSYIGIFVGILAVWAAFLSLFGDIPPSDAYARNVGEHANKFTNIMLMVLGFICILKPLGDVPWAALLGLIGGVAVGLLSLAIVPEAKIAAVLNVDPVWVYLVIFIAVATITGLLFKFWTNGIAALVKLVSNPLIALVVAAFCFIQGFMLLAAGTSLVAW